MSASDILSALRRIENRGAVETAHRISQICGQVFRYAIVIGKAERNPAADLRGALAPVKQKYHASIIDPVEIGKLHEEIIFFSRISIKFKFNGNASATDFRFQIFNTTK